MADIKVELNSAHITPRKARLVADRLRGLQVADAAIELRFRAKKAAGLLEKLLASAIANAKKNAGIAHPETLYIKEIFVDEGKPFKRFMPRAFGRATGFKKRTSHVTMVLGSHDA